ncbi:Copper fist DNA binding domain protein [Talaromyces stipitatus ATCC 10500]|uniref:Copper fist DNA binding domain protein n=1 Tax=Talaromyces stipitatus (strain ATCC 10500 / CBS 375.48 / QM 6759 / NRRL 1006) TaxID=441959 RepID=B8LY66_TALSN|nr:Copper fist DNA binding domain protein [Talaromyces stipitatus ATCC 10500]EED23311.1 Copper fist DNA binding domain protein [Talaromyces stipitatus ATCC 10500]
MLIDGEKWACEACVRGHRVSSCHHSDRTLIHVNKKGRPVSQCPHCRGLRKSRTTHAKCDCGDKKKDHHGTDGILAGGENGEVKCRCMHGQRCSCALKKDHLDPVPETGLPPLPHSAAVDLRKPRLTSTKSESTLTIFRDGHHKPAHKHNDMAHKCGMPYTIPRSHTIHGTSELAQRSADHLPLALNNGAVDTSYFSYGAEFESLPSRRRVKSEHGSPEVVAIPVPDQSNSQVPPLDLTSLSSIDAGIRAESLNQFMMPEPFPEQFQDGLFASPDAEWPTSAGAFSAPPVDWSSFPLPSAGVSTSVSQAPSYASFDLNNVSNPSYPGLTGSSSGDASEVDDFGPKPSLGHDIYDLHSLSDGSDVDQYRISSASSFAGLPQARLLSSHNLESIDIDEYLRSANASTAALEQQLQASMAMESKAIPASPQGYAISHSQPSYPTTESTQGVSIDGGQSTMADMLWASSLFDTSLPTSMASATSAAAEDPFTQPPWAE